MDKRKTAISHMDQVLDKKDREFGSERIIIRYYPADSSCHSFKPDITRSLVSNGDYAEALGTLYTTYFSYKIMSQKLSNNRDKFGKAQWDTGYVYNVPCDEGSAISEIPFYVNDMLEAPEHESVYTISPTGYGIVWTITYTPGQPDDFGMEEELPAIPAYFTFSMTDNYALLHKSCNFCLTIDEAKEFCSSIEKFTSYMMMHCLCI